LFEQLLSLLPSEPGTIALVVASIGSLLGAGLWISGARFSRFMLTLAAVTLGAAVGMKLPAWCGWSVDGMGPAVGGAVILGVSAFALHRLWVGIWLGIVLTGWSALVIWTTARHGADWHWPNVHAGRSLPAYLAQVWRTLPDQVKDYLPWFAGAAMACGITAATAWPRISMVLLWSAAGVSLLVATGAMALSRLDPAVLRRVPRQTVAQLAVLGALVLLGAALQWRITPRPKSAARSSKSYNANPAD
jgi:hypothetical protein